MTRTQSHAVTSRPFAAALALPLLAAACSSSRTIELDDKRSGTQAAVVRYMPNPERRVGLEFGYDRSEGDDDLRLDSGSVEWGGVTFNGPAELPAEWDQTSYHLGVTFRVDSSTGAGQLFSTVGVRSTEIELDLAGTDAALDQASIFGSIDYAYWFDDRLGLFVRGLLAFSRPLEDLGFVDDDEGTFFTQLIELGAALRIVDVLSLRGGWRNTRLDVDIDGASDLEIQSAGPFVGLYLGL